MCSIPPNPTSSHSWGTFSGEVHLWNTGIETTLYWPAQDSVNLDTKSLSQGLFDLHVRPLMSEHCIWYYLLSCVVTFKCLPFLILQMQVTWILDQEDTHSRYLLLSVGTDGKVLIWEHLEAHKELKLLCGFRFLTDSIPRSHRISKAKGDATIGGK